MSDNNSKEDEKVEEKEEVKDPVLNLDQAHDKAVSEVDSADEPEEKKEEPEEKEEEKKEEEPKKPEPVETPPPPVVEEKAPEPVEIPKVKVKDSEGETHEYGSTEDIPDDFEPASYKEFAVATAKLSQREIDVRSANEKAKQDALEKDRNERMDRIKQQWEIDEAALVKTGALDEDADKRKETVDGVFRTMQDEVNAGRPVNSFSQAFEIYKYREHIKSEADKKTVVKDGKKKRGGMVLPGGNASPSKSNRKGKVMEAPPSGISLDQVHENILNGL